jgi:hypothetical protein
VLTLRPFLEARRVSELQEMHAFWAGAGGTTPDLREALIEDLTGFLRDHSRVAARLRLLAEKPMRLMHLLVRAEGFTSDLPGLVAAAETGALEGYEVEAAARALGRRGFLDVGRDPQWTRNHREVYTVPRELAETISVLLMEDRRGPRQVFTLAGHLEGLSPTRRRRLASANLPAGAAHPEDPHALAQALLGATVGRDALGRARGEEIRELLMHAVSECGGLVPRSRYKRDLGAPLRWQRKRWQKFLEEAGLGTVTTLGLTDCGIELEGETTVLFAEITEQVVAGIPMEEGAIDQVAAARVDLLTDLSHFLRHLSTHPIRVTHGRTVHRAAYGRILDGLTFREDALVERAEVFQIIYDLSVILGLAEIGEDRLLMLTRKGAAWDRTPLHRKVRRVYDHFLDEKSPQHRDFHDRPLRRLLAARLAREPVGKWIPIRLLPFLARNEYLATLEEEGVRNAYRNRFQYTFEPPTEDPGELAEALVDWAMGRLYLLGVVDIGFRGQDPVALRLTEQGRRLLAGEENGSSEEGTDDALLEVSRPVVVNPDFEVLLLPEGDVNEVAHTLDRFAARVRSDEVTRYRLQRESVERAVVQGMTVDSILEFLEARSRSPVPQNVAYSVREWGERVRFARMRDAVLLEVDQEDALDRALSLEAVRALLIERLGPRVAALRSGITDWKTLEALRGLGVHLRG